ncbi:hypothetical protein CLV49_2975 [Labedella gwakjiensis]|uniref:Uncharacterized protein n=1 Tax=Labedella gwakjiensis TaxID=390269 RepID=A0A2P8GZE7_9MICO|nr:hypothetical protein [Labedella gwakjiensis]PSL39341.1 hypothetical protein CLV49_2975 [Labedella gwakjiensis]RUQ86242.1 hypothetical protein ELQ93_04375 [Labedella gwakjiensis]
MTNTSDEPTPTPDVALSDEEQTAKDRAYSPGSETETAAKQADGVPATVDEDIDRDDVNVTPGTGGPDDVGDVDVDPGELHMPHDTGAH